jgi:hypothetical protein
VWQLQVFPFFVAINKASLNIHQHKSRPPLAYVLRKKRNYWVIWHDKFILRTLLQICYLITFQRDNPTSSVVEGSFSSTFHCNGDSSAHSDSTRQYSVVPKCRHPAKYFTYFSPTEFPHEPLESRHSHSLLQVGKGRHSKVNQRTHCHQLVSSRLSFAALVVQLQHLGFQPLFFARVLFCLM